jgi:hypothetical protein
VESTAVANYYQRSDQYNALRIRFKMPAREKDNEKEASSQEGSKHSSFELQNEEDNRALLQTVPTPMPPIVRAFIVFIVEYVLDPPTWQEILVRRSHFADTTLYPCASYEI